MAVYSPNSSKNSKAHKHLWRFRENKTKIFTSVIYGCTINHSKIQWLQYITCHDSADWLASAGRFCSMRCQIGLQLFGGCVRLEHPRQHIHVSGALVRTVGRLDSDGLLGWLGLFLRSVSGSLPFYMAFLSHFSTWSLQRVARLLTWHFKTLFKSAKAEIATYS